MTVHWKSAAAACSALALLSFGALPAGAQDAARPAPAAAVDSIEGTLPDGTRWSVDKPANWNGVLLLDLDGARPTNNARPGPAGALLPPGPRPDAGPAGAPPAPRGNPFRQWLLAQGYAYGGITREPVGYDFPKAVDYILQVRDTATGRWGPAKRTLLIGNSRGAFLVRKGLELRPDVFDGGLISAGGGAGEIAVLNNKLNSLFVLKTLVDPASPLKLVNIDAQAENAALGALVDKAKATPQGRARLAFAAAMQQMTRWSSRGKPKPAPADYDAQLDQIIENFGFATAVTVRAGMEKVGGGNVSWNTGVDYADLLTRSGRRPMVEALYKKAGLDLGADLATLAKAPRISADPAAIARVEPLTTYTGKIEDPVVNIDNDDPVDPASDKLAYVRTLQRAGTDGLFRLAWSDTAGHGGMSPLDRAVGFRLLMNRVESGRWDDASLPALKALGAEIARTSSVDLGQLNLFDPGPIAPPLNTWDVANWGSYRGR